MIEKERGVLKNITCFSFKRSLLIDSSISFLLLSSILFFLLFFVEGILSSTYDLSEGDISFVGLSSVSSDG